MILELYIIKGKKQIRNILLFYFEDLMGDFQEITSFG